MRPVDLKPASVLAERHPHGVRIKYIGGCRCVPCRAANSRYETERAAARKRGESNSIVPATRAKAHLLALSRAGVGRRSVAAACDVAQSVLHGVRTGRKRRIRASTERAILAVTRDAVADRALISGARTRTQIDYLLSEGFTKSELARRLGSKAKQPSLQISDEVVTAANAAKVDRFYRLITAGGGHA